MKGSDIMTQNAFESQNPSPSGRRAWLDQFPPNKRSTIANWYHFAVRNGAFTPEAVLYHVQQTVYRRLQWANNPLTTEHLHSVLQTLQTDRASALTYAASVLAYEALPREAQQRVKAERAFAFLKKGMQGLPVTEKQMAYLRALGHVGPCPEDRAAASALIDQLRRREGQP